MRNDIAADRAVNVRIASPPGRRVAVAKQRHSTDLERPDGAGSPHGIGALLQLLNQVGAILQTPACMRASHTPSGHATESCRHTAHCRLDNRRAAQYASSQPLRVRNHRACCLIPALMVYRARPPEKLLSMSGRLIVPRRSADSEAVGSFTVCLNQPALREVAGGRNG